MAIVWDADTHGYIDRWANEMGLSPWLFNQVTGYGDGANLAEPGQDVWVQPERREIAIGIRNAHTLLSHHLGFAPRPTWSVAHIPLGALYPRRTHWLPLSEQHVQAIGKRGTTVLEAGAAVVYSDSTGAGVEDTATITVTVPTGTEAHEIHAFFRVADGAPEAASERWRIEPLTVSVSGTTATLTGHKALFVKPSVWRMPYSAPNFNRSSKRAASIADAAAFVTAVDVYRIYPDTTDAAVLIDTRTGQTVSTDLVLDDGVDGRVSLLGVYSTPFDMLRVHVWAGYPLDDYGQPDAALATALIRLANCEMPRLPVTLDDARLRVYQDDNEVLGLNDRPLSSSPLGFKNGQLAAWKIIQDYMRPQAVART